MNPGRALINSPGSFTIISFLKMLSRRHLRTRVMQVLYSYLHSSEKDSAALEKEIFRGIERSYDLYLTQLLLLKELAGEEERYYVDAPSKHLQKESPILSHLSSNIVLNHLNEDVDFSSLIEKRSISWQNDHDIVKKVFHQLRSTQEYRDYVTVQDHDAESDIDFITWLYKNVISDSEALQNSMEEKNIWWAESLDLINSMVIKTIRVSHPSKKGKLSLMPILREEEEDKEFLKKLFLETIRNDSYFSKLIAEKTKNWDVDRIAQMDVILMKMALSEILNFPAIPVKVSINEYIDMSKEFSTPKSRVFINGVLDSIVKELNSEGGITKTGRGLIE